MPFVEKLHRMGYTIFATAGTADFIQEHNIPVRLLETIDEDADIPLQKREYSLNQHLSNNLIDLYVNLPSKNRYRRPASYMSRGYRTRRLAIDFLIPLITNIKCAKLFVDAILRVKNFDITANDYISSFETTTLPGLINVASLFGASREMQTKVSMAALSGGFTTICNYAEHESQKIVDRKSLNVAFGLCGESFCDYLVGASVSNDTDMQFMIGSVGSVHISDKDFSLSIAKSLFTRGSHFLPIVFNISNMNQDSNLASILLLATFNDCPVHVSNVSSRKDIELIVMAKEKFPIITCDVCLSSLFADHVVSNESFSIDDMNALWENFESIDCLSVKLSVTESNFGYDLALPLLLNAVNSSRMTLEDIVAKLHTNPMRIFGLHPQEKTSIEIEIEKTMIVEDKLSPFFGQTLVGSVHRVILRDETVYLDGKYFGQAKGKQISHTSIQISVPSPRKRLVSLCVSTASALVHEPTQDVKQKRIAEKVTFVPLRRESLGDAALLHVPDSHLTPSSPKVEFKYNHFKFRFNI